MPEAVARDMVVANLDHQLMAERLPLPGSVGAPSARPARRLSGEAWRPGHRFQSLRQCWPLVVRNSGCVADMVEEPVIIEEAEKKRADEPVVAPAAKPADDAARRLQPLHFDHGPLARL